MASQTSCSTFVVNTVAELKAALAQEFGKGVRVRAPPRAMCAPGGWPRGLPAGGAGPCATAPDAASLARPCGESAAAAPALSLRSRRSNRGSRAQDYRTAFCINCGATQSTEELLEPLDTSARECVRLVFVDSHRPVHHSLNNEQDQACVLLHDPDGGDVPVDAIPLADAAFDVEHDGVCRGAVLSVSATHMWLMIEHVVSRPSHPSGRGHEMPFRSA